MKRIRFNPEELKDRNFGNNRLFYQFEKWKGRKKEVGSLFFWNFFLSGSEFPTLWTIHSNKPVRVKGWPPFIRSIWKSAKKDEKVLLRLDVFECSSLNAAHDFLLRHLGEFNLPIMEYQEEFPLGDVAFSSPEGRHIIFSRGNLVVHASNAGSNLISVQETAHQLDLRLLERLEVQLMEQSPMISRFIITEAKFHPGITLPLDVKARDPFERPIFFKFYSNSGEVLLEKDQLVYKPKSTDLQTIHLSITNSNQFTNQKKLTFSLD